MKPFLNAMANQSLLSVKTCFDEDEVTGNNQWLPYKSDILVATASSFLQFIKVGLLNLTSISLIILDQCHHATYPDHPFALILNHADNNNIVNWILGQKLLGCLQRFLVDYHVCKVLKGFLAQWRKHLIARHLFLMICWA